MTVSADRILSDIKPGDSIAIDGICLTVISFSTHDFTVEVTAHTLESTTLNAVSAGIKVNLERALKLGDRFGGHIVQGHIDGLGRVSSIHYKEGANEIVISLDKRLLSLMVTRGSVTVNGVSLTIAEKSSRGIKLVIIPATLEMTTLGDLKPGSRVNIESDLIIRWIADRFASGEIPIPSSISPEAGNFHLED